MSSAPAEDSDRSAVLVSKRQKTCLSSIVEDWRVNCDKTHTPITLRAVVIGVHGGPRLPIRGKNCLVNHVYIYTVFHYICNYKCVAELSGSPPGPAHASRRRHPSAAIESARLLPARRYLQRGRFIPSIRRGCCECTTRFLSVVTLTCYFLTLAF